MIIIYLLVIGYLSVFAGGCCAVMIGPTLILRRLGLAKMSLAAALAVTTALTVDYLYNWDGIEYPHWIYGLPTYLFPLTFLTGLVAIGMGFMAVVEQAAGDGEARPQPPPRLRAPSG